MSKCKIADVVFDLEPKYAYFGKRLAEFLSDGEETPEYSVVSDDASIERERKKYSLPENLPAPLIEDLFFERRVSDYILGKKNGTLFHGSAIEYGGGAYVFTARSGTGKSTHAGLWRELLGDRVKMINDDKPIVRIIDGKPVIYGTPWKGKHGLGGNIKAPVKAICRLVQAKENSIREVSVKEFLPTFFVQCYHVGEKRKKENFLEFLDGLLTGVKLFELKCDISIAAAELSFTAMTGDKI